MASTNVTLGEHWEIFIKNEIASGRDGSASEVVRDALRTLEERKAKLEALWLPCWGSEDQICPLAATGCSQ